MFAEPMPIALMSPVAESTLTTLGALLVKLMSPTASLGLKEYPTLETSSKSKVIVALAGVIAVSIFLTVKVPVTVDFANCSSPKYSIVTS